MNKIENKEVRESIKNYVNYKFVSRDLEYMQVRDTAFTKSYQYCKDNNIPIKQLTINKTGFINNDVQYAI